MDKNAIAPKKERNYIVDIVKIIATILCVGAHYQQIQIALWGVGKGPELLNPLTQFSYIYQCAAPLFGWTGYITISFFTFTTGYWFMNAFQRTKKQGVMGKGKDGTILFRYWARNYANYGPYVLFGTIFAMLFIYLAIPELRFNFSSFIGSFVLALPQIFGFEGWGLFDCQAGTNSVLLASQLTEGFTLPMSRVYFEWDSVLWYMYGIIAWMGIAYLVFMKSEKAGLMVFCPIVLTVYNCVYHINTVAWTFYEFDTCCIRLLGPVTYGIYGWYIVNALKKHTFTKGEKMLLTIVSVGSLAVTIYGLYSSLGGFNLQDYALAVFLTTALLGKDSFTPKLNSICKYIPFIKHANTISLCLFLLHSPIMYWFVWAFSDSRYEAMTNWMKSFSPGVLFLIFIAGFFVLCVPFYFIEKYAIKKYSNWLLKVTKADEPIVFEEPKAEVPATV